MATTLGVNIDVESVLEQLEKEKAANQPPTKKTEFSIKNYLQARLMPNEKSKTMTIRILPFSPEGGAPFKKVWIHTVKVDKEVSPGGWRTFVCPIHNGFDDKCPFCETSAKARELRLNSVDEAEKKKYGDVEFMNHAKEAWIARVVERGHEEDGVKFWLFNNSRKKDGPYDKIMNLFDQRLNAAKAKGKVNNIFDVNEGKDLILHLTKDSNNKTVIQITDDDEKSPLSENYEEAKAWIESTKQWNEVYVAKPYEYTSIIVQGGVPVWNREKKGWVEKTEFTKEMHEADAREMAENLSKPSKDFSEFTDEIKDGLGF